MNQELMNERRMAGWRNSYECFSQEVGDWFTDSGGSKSSKVSPTKQQQNTLLNAKNQRQRYVLKQHDKQGIFYQGKPRFIMRLIKWNGMIFKSSQWKEYKSTNFLPCKITQVLRTDRNTLKQQTSAFVTLNQDILMYGAARLKFQMEKYKILNYHSKVKWQNQPKASHICQSFLIFILCLNVNELNSPI